MSSNSDSSSSVPYGMSAVNCTTYLPLQANSDISGIGVQASFLATVYLTLFCCVVIYILKRLEKKATDNGAQRIARWSFALESAIISFSDQQLVTGISIVVGGLQQLEFGLPVYYFQQMGNLAWFSTMTHILTLTVLRDKMREKLSPAMRTLRIVLMGFLVVLLSCIMTPMGYINSAYGFYGFINTTGGIQGPIPMEFPAWCLYHPSLEWEDESGQPMIHKGAFGYNTIYGLLTLGIILYGYTSRVLLLFPGFLSQSMLRIPSGQPWLALESALANLQTLKRIRATPITCSAIFVRICAWLGHVLLYSFCILIISGKQVYGSKIWELTWLAMAIAWGTIRLFFSPWEDVYGSVETIESQNNLSQQDIWGFGQVVVLILLLLPFLSFAEAYLNFTKDSPSPSRTPSNASRHLSLSSHDDGLQHEIYGKRWYRCLIVLWHLISIMIGAFALTFVAPDGGSELSPLNQYTGGSSSNSAIYPLWSAIVFLNLGLIWMFILFMLPEWSLLTYKSIRITVTIVWVAISGIWLYLGIMMYNIWGL